MSRSAQVHSGEAAAGLSLSMYTENGMEEAQEDEEGEEEEEAREEEEEQEEDGDLEDEVDASRLEKFMRDRRRAQSLPALLSCGAVASGERKRVKFADSMGLNLASVKHFSALEEPQIPTKVLSRHRSLPLPSQHQEALLCQNFRSTVNLDTHRLVTCFPEPRDTELRVQQLRVCLEKVSITPFDVRGQIRVLCDRGAVREVGVRYTFNEWLSHVDAQALRVSADDVRGLRGERFSFTVYTPPFMDRSCAVHFAVYLKSEQGEFWDNNQGLNYTLRHRSVHGNARDKYYAF